MSKAEEMERTIREAMQAPPLEYEAVVDGYIIRSQCGRGCASVRKAGRSLEWDSRSMTREQDVIDFLFYYNNRW